jgi:hypothetical protein
MEPTRAFCMAAAAWPTVALGSTKTAGCFNRRLTGNVNAEIAWDESRFGISLVQCIRLRVISRQL